MALQHYIFMKMSATQLPLPYIFPIQEPIMPQLYVSKPIAAFRTAFPMLSIIIEESLMAKMRATPCAFSGLSSPSRLCLVTGEREGGVIRAVLDQLKGCLAKLDVLNACPVILDATEGSRVVTPISKALQLLPGRSVGMSSRFLLLAGNVVAALRRAGSISSCTTTAAWPKSSTSGSQWFWDRGIWSRSHSLSHCKQN
ncbi:hypothetical protein K438DRAFT_1756667 [Mycena galopus ATCC 62051]|nr:hypothetical protein K438DRAFT_1756667 [Mycena galopus ATCC 62051]